MKFFPDPYIKFIISRTLLAVLFLLLQSAMFSQPGNEQQDTVTVSKVIAEDSYIDSARIPFNPDSENNDEDVVEYFDVRNSVNPFDSSTKQQLPDSVIKKMQQDKDFWYANYVFEKEMEKENVKANANGEDLRLKKDVPLRDQTWFKTLMWLIIIGGFVFALISYLGSSNAGLFRRSAKRITDESQLEETENIFEINYSERIDRAVRSGNYQLAVRLHFLQMLKILSGRNMIQYKQGRTNFDYLMQLRSTSYYNDFFRLTRNYEYAWFGNFAVNEEMYHIIKSDFEKFDRGFLGK